MSFSNELACKFALAEANAELTALRKELEAARAVKNELVESVAKAIYAQWTVVQGYCPWVEHGNSIYQDAARKIARAAIAQEAKP